MFNCSEQMMTLDSQHKYYYNRQLSSVIRVIANSMKNTNKIPFYLSNFVVEKAYIEFWANSVSTGIWIWVCTFVLFFHDLYHPYGTK